MHPINFCGNVVYGLFSLSYMYIWLLEIFRTFGNTDWAVGRLFLTQAVSHKTPDPLIFKMLS